MIEVRHSTLPGYVVVIIHYDSLIILLPLQDSPLMIYHKLPTRL